MNPIDDPSLKGTKIGQQPRPFPGMLVTSKKLNALSDEIAKLETAKYELDSIRATLLLNFGVNSAQNAIRHFAIYDDPTVSTTSLLMTVLTKLTE